MAFFDIDENMLGEIVITPVVFFNTFSFIFCEISLRNKKKMNLQIALKVTSAIAVEVSFELLDPPKR